MNSWWWILALIVLLFIYRYFLNLYSRSDFENKYTKNNLELLKLENEEHTKDIYHSQTIAIALLIGALPLLKDYRDISIALFIGAILFILRGIVSYWKASKFYYWLKVYYDKNQIKKVKKFRFFVWLANSGYFRDFFIGVFGGLAFQIALIVKGKFCGITDWRCWSDYLIVMFALIIVFFMGAIIVYNFDLSRRFKRA